MRIEVVRGSEANALLANESFRAQWTALCEACPWATPMQSYPFAEAWYAVYSSRFEPVFITSRDAEGRLDGLLALAYGRKRTLIPVGGHQAEYHCWISTPELGEQFGREALRIVRKQFPSSKLTFRYVPPEVPLGWLDSAPDIANRSMATPWKRPLMRLDEETLRERFSRKNIRTRVNKLQKMGYTGIERVTDADGWDPTFDRFIGYHDMRRIAASGNAPFADDTLKKQFHVELMRRGSVPLCVTALKVGGEVISAQLDLVGPKDTHLALGAYAPWMSKHAVGKIHILELARMMMKEGRTRLDLTPGDDPYKADFATDWDTVQVFTCYPNRRSLWAARMGRCVERMTRRLLQRLDTTPARARMVLSEIARRPFAAVASGLLAARDRWWPSRDQTIVYTRASKDGGDKSRTGNTLLSRNSIPDIMAYRPRTLDMATHAYMAQVGDRLSDGMTAYTRVEEGRLRYAGWLTDQPSAVLDETICQGMSLPERCGVVFDVQSYRSGGQEETARVMEELVAEAERLVPGAKTVVVLVPASDTAQRRLVEAMGFRRGGALAKAAGLVTLRRPPFKEMLTIASATLAAILLWGYTKLSDIAATEQRTMPMVAEVLETLS